MRMTWKATCGMAMAMSLFVVVQAYSQVGQARNQREQNPLERRAAGQHQLNLASKLLDMSVKDKANQTIGQIQDLVIDESGQVQYLAVSTQSQDARTGVPGARQPQPRTPRTTTQPGQAGADQNEKLTLIPFELAQIHEGQTPTQNYASVNLDKDKITQAPSFTRTQLTMGGQQAQWMSQVDKFFNRQKGNVARPNLNDREERKEQQK